MAPIRSDVTRNEILTSLASDNPGRYWRRIAELGLLKEIFPELNDGRGCQQNSHHGEDVFDHLVRCLDESVKLTNNPMLRLAVLLHDVAKPHTKHQLEGQEATFHCHETMGASIVYQWMQDYGFPQKDCEYVSKMVRHHQWYFQDNTADKTLKRWLKETGKDGWRDLITLRMADRMGNIKKAGLPAMTREMQFLVDRVEGLIKKHPVLFIEDLAVGFEDVRPLIEQGAYKGVMSNLLGIVIDDPKKNTRDHLLEYVSRVYGSK